MEIYEQIQSESRPSSPRTYSKKKMLLLKAWRLEQVYKTTSVLVTFAKILTLFYTLFVFFDVFDFKCWC